MHRVGLWRWRKDATKQLVDLDELEGLLDEAGSGKKKKKKKGVSKSGKSGASKSNSERKSGRPQSEWDVQQKQVTGRWTGGLSEWLVRR